jgi:hypothetical protein
MRSIRHLFALFAFVVALAATPALASGPLLLFTGTSPTLSFTPSDCQVGVQTCTAIFTNQGTGTIAGHPKLTWRYEERGTVLPNLTQVIDSATYTIALKAKPKKSVVLHVIPSTYTVSYDDPATAPCSHGSFSASTVEGAFIQGTFECLGGLPAASMEFTITAGPAMPD